jgi:hypothetical protein
VTTPLLPTDPPAVGPFRVTARLGTGGMGRVFLAVAPDARVVAVKVIRPEYADDPAFRRRFAREAAAAARVGAPGIARVLAADPEGPVPYLVTEYVPGPTLGERIERDGPLPPPELARFAAGMAEALAAVHAAGVVHRDLKPANVVLSPDGPRILDFGIARPEDAATRHTETGVLVGSVGWMAPEVLRGATATAAVDVFAWGALVAFAGTGRKPFGEGPDVAVAHRVLAGPPPDLAGLPPRLAALAASALAPDPAARPPSAGLAASLGAPAAAPAPTAALTAFATPTRVEPPAPAPAAAPSARAPSARAPRPAPAATAPAPAAPAATAVPPRPRRRWPWMLAGAAGSLALVTALTPRTPQPNGTATPAPSATPRVAASTPAPRATPRRTPTPPPVTSPDRPAGGGVLVAAALAPVQDAGTLFRITDLRCGLTTIGSGASAYDLDAGREACTALVTVRNVGRNPHGAGIQYLRDRSGRAYASNGFLTRAMDRPALELRLLQPGERLQSALVWEVPPGFRPVEVVVHGDLVTLGARRRLG